MLHSESSPICLPSCKPPGGSPRTKGREQTRAERLHPAVILHGKGVVFCAAAHVQLRTRWLRVGPRTGDWETEVLAPFCPALGQISALQGSGTLHKLRDTNFGKMDCRTLPTLGGARVSLTCAYTPASHSYYQVRGAESIREGAALSGKAWMMECSATPACSLLRGLPTLPPGSLTLTKPAPYMPCSLF